MFFAPFETDKFKCGTGANTNAKEFVEEQEVLAICLWRDDDATGLCEPDPPLEADRPSPGSNKQR